MWIYITCTYWIGSLKDPLFFFKKCYKEMNWLILLLFFFRWIPLLYIIIFNNFKYFLSRIVIVIRFRLHVLKAQFLTNIHARNQFTLSNVWNLHIHICSNHFRNNNVNIRLNSCFSKTWECTFLVYFIIIPDTIVWQSWYW